MAMQFDKRNVQQITRGATHVRATVAWQVPEPVLRRTPILRNHWTLAWQILALHLNGLPRLLEDLAESPGSFVSDARARYNVRLAAAVSHMRELEAREYAALMSRERGRPGGYVSNLYGARFEFEMLNRFALDWMHAVLEDTQSGPLEDRLARAAGGALLYILMCYRNIFDVRELETGEIDPVANWGGSAVYMDSRSQLAHLGVLPELEVGIFGTPEVALREELISEVLARVEGADIVSGEATDVFGKLRQEFFNAAKREPTTKGVSMGAAHLGGLPFNVLAGTVTALLSDAAMRNQLIVAVDIANQWRSFAASEHKGILEWMLGLCHDAAVVREITIQMDQNFSDIQGASMDRLSTHGFEKAVELLTRYESESEDLRYFFEQQLAELAALHPTRITTMSLKHVRDFPIEELTRAVFMPSISFEYADRREKNGVISHVNVVRTYSLGAPRFCATDVRLGFQSMVLSAEFLAPFSLRNDGASVDIMPMLVRKADALPAPLDPLKVEIQNIVRKWQADVTDFAALAVQQGGELVAEYPSFGESADGKEVKQRVDWRPLLEQAALARLLASGEPVFLTDLPAALVYWLGFFVNDDMQVLQFSVANNASDLLQEYVAIDGGFVWVDHSRPASMKQVGRVMSKAHQFKWEDARKANFLPLFAIKGDEKVEPRKGRFADERFTEGWWMQVRNHLLPVRAGMAPDLERVGKDLTLMLPLAPLHPDVAVLRHGAEVQSMMMMNGRAATHATRLLQLILDDSVFKFMKREIKAACRQYLRGVAERWLRVMEQRFVHSVPRAATLFLRSGDERGPWLQAVAGTPGRSEQVNDLQVALVAMILAELGGDAYGVLHLAHEGRMDLLADRRLKLAAELWSPDDTHRSKLQDMAGVIQEKAAIMEESSVAEVVTLCKRIVGLGLDLGSVADHMDWLRGVGEAVLTEEKQSSKLRQNRARSNPLLTDSPVKDDGSELDKQPDLGADDSAE